MTEWNITSSHRHVQFACHDRDVASRAHAIIPTNKQTNKRTDRRTYRSTTTVSIIVTLLVFVVDIITTSHKLY